MTFREALERVAAERRAAPNARCIFTGHAVIHGEVRACTIMCQGGRHHIHVIRGDRESHTITACDCPNGGVK